MTLSEIRRTAIDPALLLLPAKMTSSQAEIMLLAIGLQESRFLHRRQIMGPARSFWQGELTGGMILVLGHPLTKEHAKKLCAARGVKPVAQDVYEAIEFDDVLAAGLARLLLWTDPHPLPAIGDIDGSLSYYLRNWRPGKPHPEYWPGNYRQAMEEINATQRPGSQKRVHA